MPTQIQSLTELLGDFNTKEIPTVPVKDLAKAGQSVLEQSEGLVDSTNTITAEVGETTNTLAQINDAILESSTARKNAQQELAKVQEQETLQAQQASRAEMDVAKSVVTGAESEKTEAYLIGQINTAFTNVQDLEKTAQEGNFFQRFIANAELGEARKSLQRARFELDAHFQTERNIVKAAYNTDVMAKAAARNGFADDRAAIERKVQTVGAVIADLQTQGTVTRTRRDDLIKNLSVDQQAVDTLIKQMQILSETNRLTRSATAAELEKAQLDTYNRKVKQNDDDAATILKMQQDYISQQYPNIPINSFNDPDSLKTFPEAYNAFVNHYNTSRSRDAATFTYLRNKRLNGTMTFADEKTEAIVRAKFDERARIGEALVAEEISQKPELKSDSKALAALQDKYASYFIEYDQVMLADKVPAGVLAEADRIATNALKEMQESSNLLFQSRQLLVGKATDALQEFPELEVVMQQESNVDAFETFLSKEFANVDWSIATDNPAGSVDGVINTVADALSAFEDPAERARKEREISEGAASYYKGMLKEFQKTTGLYDVPSISIKGVSIRDSSGGTFKMDLTNAGNWVTMLQRERIKRRVKEAEAANILQQGLRGRIGVR